MSFHSADWFIFVMFWWIGAFNYLFKKLQSTVAIFETDLYTTNSLISNQICLLLLDFKKLHLQMIKMLGTTNQIFFIKKLIKINLSSYKKVEQVLIIVGGL